jgi:hypothetical protein
MFSLQLQQSVLDSLRNLKSIDTLKKLFWSQLNYERINQPLSRRKLTEAVANELIEEPLLLASGGNNNAFHVIYSRLKSEELSRQGERKIVNHLLKEHPYALFIFSNKSHSRWHFLNVKYDNTLQKRKLFRRITIGEDEQLRTASEIISRLDLEDIPPNASPLEIQTRHDQEFDVEAVTQEFFNTYRQIFEKVEELIQGIGGNERKRLFTQKLFNRLMFIAFIQKKGWLKFQGKTDYLSVLWEDYQDHHTNTTTNFYRDRLSHLFFAGLNNTQQADVIGINNGGFLKSLIGNVPYLNGGLFEQDEDDNNPQIIIPDECIDAILHDLFQRFAFTVTESTPLDVDVAVDPEMLGKVFEELVTGRHESGSYYTPKPIVSFMCREALKGYLKTEVPGESSDAISQYIDEHLPDNITNSGEIFDALRRVRCCDLACGSGAYLLGMLHELLDLRNCLFASKKIGTDSTYNSKLEIIENNLYGVDVDIFAVNIARLRLWLSLAVDYEGEQPKPLPNLKYKIEIGDSLIAPSPTTTGVIRHEFINQYRQKKAEYMRTHEGGKKQNLEKEINDLKTQIRLFSYGNSQASAGFDWAVEFAEVFADGGFDIVVANPPYVRQELIKHFKPTLQKIYPDIYTGTADLYCFFYARTLQLLKTGGMLAFISSNKWFRAKYGEKLRKHIADTCHVHSITDFGDLPVFKSAAVLVMMFIAQNIKLIEQPSIFTQVKSLSPPYPNVKEIINQYGNSLLSDSFKGSDWILADSNSAHGIQVMESKGIPLFEYINTKIFYGVKTGCNKAFIIDEVKRGELIAKNIKSSEIIRPLVLGDDIRKWHIESKRRWLITTEIGVNINKYPAIFDHLKQWQAALEKRSDKGNYWWELRPCDYYHLFNKPKIIYPVIAKESRFAFDITGTFTNDKGFIIPVSDLYLLGVLNSSHVWEYLKSICSELLGKSIELRSIYMNKIPIPIASTTEKETISQLVQKCLDAKGVNCETWEKEIDERVAALYGL